MTTALLNKKINALTPQDVVKVSDYIDFLLFQENGNTVYDAPEIENPFVPKSEEELIKRIDESLDQISRGESRDADEVIDEILEEMEL